jgi:hypothetical protein
MMRVVGGNSAKFIVALAMAMLPAHSAVHSLEALVEAVVRNGPDSELPAHLSVILGVSRVERQTAVKQAVMRNGATVKTFNVCTANHADVVIMTYDEQTHSTKAYLTSPTGKLRKAVSYQSGAAANERSLPDARGDFGREVAFWTDLAHGPVQSK